MLVLLGDPSLLDLNLHLPMLLRASHPSVYTKYTEIQFYILMELKGLKKRDWIGVKHLVVVGNIYTLRSTLITIQYKNTQSLKALICTNVVHGWGNMPICHCHVRDLHLDMQPWSCMIWNHVHDHKTPWSKPKKQTTAKHDSTTVILKWQR